jgi:hypothetical protein
MIILSAIRLKGTKIFTMIKAKLYKTLSKCNLIRNEWIGFKLTKKEHEKESGQYVETASA